MISSIVGDVSVAQDSNTATELKHHSVVTASERVRRWTVIRDANALAELRTDWAGVERLRERLKMLTNVGPSPSMIPEP